MKFNTMRYDLLIMVLILFLSDTTLGSTDDLLGRLMLKVLTVDERMDNLETQFQSAFDGLELRLNERLDKMTDLLSTKSISMDSEISHMKETITTAVATILQPQYTVFKKFMKVEKQVLSEAKHQLNANVTDLKTVIEQALLIYDKRFKRMEKLLARNVKEMRSGFDELSKQSAFQTGSELDKQDRKYQELSKRTADVESQITSQGHQLSEHASQLDTTQRNLRVYKSSCSSVSDRENALENKTACGVNQFLCEDGSCIQREQVCDNNPDCAQEEDERNCDACGVNPFLCEDGSCIPREQVCDNNPDCAQEEDELDCDGSDSCAEGQFRCADGSKCLDSGRVCDKLADCADGTDESDC